MPELDDRSERNIGTLNKNAQEWAREFMRRVLAADVLPDGWTVKIISGNRTYAEQEALWSKGRTAPGPKVTNARGGQSNHNFGIAWDIGLFDAKGTYNPPGNLGVYRAIGKIGKALGLTWGGDWRGMVDLPHFEVKTPFTLEQKRAFMARIGGVPTPKLTDTQSPVAPSERIVLIQENGKATDIPARLVNNQAWVAVRAFVDHFGGELAGVAGTFGAALFTVVFGGKAHKVAGRIENTVGMARFSDLNAILDWPFTYRAGVLDIDTAPVGGNS